MVFIADQNLVEISAVTFVVFYRHLSSCKLKPCHRACTIAVSSGPAKDRRLSLPVCTDR